ncbi:Uncharacterised protein [Achromobacter xylosoxidans]|nr:Uncharacterised protein [Achromobacter xylosoxidans]
MLLQILATWPAPAGPAWKMFLPIFSSTGRARSSAAAWPPTMKVSVPAAAPPVPPETGASIMAIPRTSAAWATLRAESGAMVLHSITSALDGILPSRSWSRYRPSTCLLAGSIEITTSAPLTASAAEAADLAPASVSTLTAAGTRSNTARLWPALTRFNAMGAPMLPKPINAILLMMSCLLLLLL